MTHNALHGGKGSAHICLGTNAAVVLKDVGFAHNVSVGCLIRVVQGSDHAARHTHGNGAVLTVPRLDQLSDLGNRTNAVQLGEGGLAAVRLCRVAKRNQQYGK